MAREVLEILEVQVASLRVRKESPHLEPWVRSRRAKELAIQDLAVAHIRRKKAKAHHLLAAAALEAIWDLEWVVRG